MTVDHMWYFLMRIGRFDWDVLLKAKNGGVVGETKCEEAELPGAEAVPPAEVSNEETAPATQERRNSSDINRVPSNENSNEMSGAKKSNSLMTSIRYRNPKTSTDSRD